MTLGRVGRVGSQDGFTLIEMMVSMAIMLVVTGAIFGLAAGGQSAFRTQPEMADMQQRLRVAADQIYRDLLAAGAGMDRGAAPGPLSNFLPAVRPARRGAINPDGDLSFAADRIAILFVPRTRSQTSLQLAMTSTTSDLIINPAQAGCQAGTPCGFASPMRALIFDATTAGAGYDTFTVTGTTAGSIQHAAPNPAFSKIYPANSLVTEVEEHVYYHDVQNQTLMHYDAHQADDALVENLVGVNFTYYVDPDPTTAPKPAAGQANCVYDAGNPPVPLLKNHGGVALKPLAAADLIDGPVCGSAPNRFDGDLLRVRKIRVALRVQSGLADLRGSGGDFKQAGSSTSGNRAPDYTMNFEVAPRNLNLIR